MKHRPEDKVKQFIETYCIQSKSPWNGKPIRLMDWQLDGIIRPLYGTVDEQGQRQYKRCGIWICKKVGKSTLCASLALYHLLEQPGSEVYVIASNVMQASVVFNQAADFAETHPALAGRLWIRRNIKAIEDRKNKSIFRVLSSEPEGKSGISPTCLIMDELAEWPRATARDTWDKLYNASIARKNWLHISISTAQYDKAHIGYEQFQYAQNVKSQEIEDPTFLPVIYSLDEQEDWTDPKNWEKVCPAWNVTIPADSYFEDYETVKNDPIQEQRFRTFRLCQWVGSSQQWIASNVWAATSTNEQEEDFYNSPVFVGIDGATKGDLFAYSILVPRDKFIFVFPRFFISRGKATAVQKRDNVPYLQWANLPASNLFITEGDTIDTSEVIRKLVEDSQKFRFESVGFDPTGLELFRQELEYKHRLPMVEVPQTPTYMVAPTNLFHRKVLAGELKHPNNPILNWNLQNCVPRIIGQDSVMIDKKKCLQRVDGITSIIIALNRLMGNENQQVKEYDANFAFFV